VPWRSSTTRVKTAPGERNVLARAPKPPVPIWQFSNLTEPH